MLTNINQTGIFVRTALMVFLLVGGLIGLTSLVAPFTGYPINHAHRLQHIHLQVWYFIGGFVLAAGFRILPQLSARPITYSWIPGLTALLFLLNAVLWTFLLPFQFPEPGFLSYALLGMVAIEIMIWSLFLLVVLNSLLRSRKKGLWRWVASTGLLISGLCVAGSGLGWASFTDLLSFSPPLWSRTGYMGFLFVGIPLLAMGISGRVLRNREDPDFTYLLGVILIVLSTVSFSGLPGLESLNNVGPVTVLPGFLLFAHGIQLHKQTDRLNIPGFVHGVVVAFSFVLLFAVLYALNQYTGITFTYRGMIHVWALGFLTVLIMAFGTWIFPAAAGKVPINSPSVLVAIYMVATGTLFRVLAPAIVNLTPAGGTAYSVLLFGGGLLQYTGVATFAVSLFRYLPSFTSS